MNDSTPAWSYENKVDGKDEWLTPIEIIHALGRFDLDPCAPENRPWDTAAKHFSEKDNGLIQPWAGRVWCNPPYKTAKDWIKKCKEHGDCIVLIFARTETKVWFDHIWNGANSLLFIKGRLTFYNVDGSKPRANSGAPSCLVAYGDNNTTYLENALTKGLIDGKLIRL